MVLVVILVILVIIVFMVFMLILVRRGERERGILFSSFKKRKRKLFFHFPEEKEKFEMLFLNFEKRNRVLEMDSSRYKDWENYLGNKLS